MSTYNNKMKKTTIVDFKKNKNNKKISMVTCYDFAFAKLINESDIDAVLVGDSLANVVLGLDSTPKVTMDQMVHHTAAVARGLQHKFLVADMPFLSYRVSKEQAVLNAGRFLQEGGANAVKLEGGDQAVCENIRAIIAAQIPVMGHIGLTPQSVNRIGGYRLQGRNTEDAERIISDAVRLDEAGVFAIVLEMVPKELAGEITRRVKASTIGIGAGPETDGQILVLHDLLGFDTGFSPKFVKRYAKIGDATRVALNDYANEVNIGAFPTQEYYFE